MCLPPSQLRQSLSLLDPLHSHSLAYFPRSALKSGPQIRSYKIQSIRHPWSPIVSSTLPQGFIQALLPTLHVHLTGCDLAAPPNWLYNALPCTLALPDTSADGCTLQRDAPDAAHPSISALSTRPSLTLYRAQVLRGVECGPPGTPFVT